MAAAGEDEALRQRVDAAVARCEAPIHPDFLIPSPKAQEATATTAARRFLISVEGSGSLQ
ncbi:unnamed protein product [Symbiodinium sp. CCMP2592]|nr:unnamed protein product [Symbiodinium sp. CCMP2592]